MHKISFIKKLLFFLNNKQKIKLSIISFIMTLSALLNLTSIASIVPFLSIAINPQLIKTNTYLNFTYNFLGFNNETSFLIIFGFVVLFIFVLTTSIKTYVSWSIISFGMGLRYDVSNKLYRKYLYNNYSFFLNKNSSEMITHTLTNVDKAMTGVITPCLNIISAFLVFFFIITFLLFVNLKLAIILVLFFGSAYILIYFFVKKISKKSGERMIACDKELLKILTESFGGIKEIKIAGIEDNFLKKFLTPSKKYLASRKIVFAITTLPSAFFEILTMVGVMLITLYVIYTSNNFTSIIPMICLYAVSARQLIPAMQQIYTGATGLQIALPALDKVHADFYVDPAKTINITSKKNILAFKKEIHLNYLSFKYDNTKINTVDNVNIKINANSSVGFVGETGAGKTTIIDIILGLLIPHQGQLLVDGVMINETNVLSWMKNIGYVPQNIFLCDDTVRNNIAFGEHKKSINNDAVISAAKLANIHDFIINELPKGYDSIIGERGIRISGGQRQRLGIARSLYRNPSVIVFDEATSALDNLTEQIIIDSIQSLSNRKTIIVIAHRLTTVKNCDKIFVMEKGKIVDEGNYQYLINNCKIFKDMTQGTFKDKLKKGKKIT